MKNKVAKFIIPVISIILFNFCQETKMEKLEDILSTVKNAYAPDKRTAIFDVNYEAKDGRYVFTGETNNNDAKNELIYQLKINEIDSEVDIKVLPDVNLGYKKFGIVNVSVANLRTNPKHSAELATQSLLGTIIKVLKEEDGWYLVQTPDKYISWVDEDGVILVNESEIDIWKKSENVIVVKNNSTLYENPNLESEIISDLVLGNILKFIETKNEFTKVECPDLRSGFVKSIDIQKFENWKRDTISTSEKIISSAKKFIGIPYLWGGTSSKGLDCSGFTKTIFYMNGVILPRDASQQVNIGKLISSENNFKDLLPGDLLFFGKKQRDSEKEKITHVALYIGEGKYIHASGRVRYNNLFKESSDFNEYRFNTFIRAKRIIGNFDSGENLVKNNEFYK
ncbi:MAG: C40 family peptidase [Ignavibacteriae bacterium]|nr:C40 family peptidase [Ignavibacteriota bacterium]